MFLKNTIWKFLRVKRAPTLGPSKFTPSNLPQRNKANIYNQQDK